MNIRSIACGGLVILCTFFVVPVALAHSTIPRLEISLGRANPGEVVSVRGVSFDRDDIVDLTLLGTGTEFSFGEVTADPEGEFNYNAVLPVDLAEGSYYFRATTVHHWVISPPLTVRGIAVVGEDSNTFRDQSDVELGPIPTFVPTDPGVSTAAAPMASVRVESSPASSGLSTTLFVLAALIVFVIVFGFVMLRKRPR